MCAEDRSGIFLPGFAEEAASPRSAFTLCVPAAERMARVSDLRPSASAAFSRSRTQSATFPDSGAPSNAACGASPNPPGVSGSDAS
jgi:hypothetical protein